MMGACAPSPPATEEERAFREASQKINTFDGTREAFGNTDAARELAGRFSTLFRQLREIGFSGGQKGMLTQGHFLTYCRMDPGRVCVLVHVPLLRKFTEEAQKSLLDLAWQTASALLEKQPGTQLAVGLRGVLLYDGVAIGRVGEEPKRTFGAGGEKELYPFFAALPAGSSPATPSSEAQTSAPTRPPSPAGDEPPSARPITREQALLNFVTRLREPSPDARLGALAGIRHMGPDAGAAVPDVARVLSSDPDVAVRVDAARTLGRIGSGAARTALEVARQDKDSAVRDAVAAALREVDGGRP
jgi:hypothetical protein